MEPSSPNDPGSEAREPSLPLAYHERTKHRFERFAAGPETLDWDAQPAPFRRYLGAPITPLRLLSELGPEDPIVARLEAAWSFPPPGRKAPAWTLDTLSVFLQVSLGITAWKSYGPDRWAVRANPSSGNLHPVEAYLIAVAMPQLPDGVYHYLPEQHALEQRAHWSGAPPQPPGLYLALTTLIWREAWKYGERAFRYCQLDVGHAVGALSVAAALLGATLCEDTALPTAGLGELLGLEHDPSAQRATEREEPELLLRLSEAPRAELGNASAGVAALHFVGAPSVIDARPHYRWPLLEQIAHATRRVASARLPGSEPTSRPAPTAAALGSTRPAREVLLGRRSAQRFDSAHVMAQADFFALLHTLLPVPAAPWSTLATSARIDLALFVHRVTGLESGLYLLLRRGEQSRALLAWLCGRFMPSSLPDAPAHLPLKLLAAMPPRALMQAARALHCQQDIASSSCFALTMIAELEGPVASEPAVYRDLHREAGVLGQALYLQAEALALRGTGIGCYFDDPLHELLGIERTPYRSLYSFTVGKAIEDPRIELAPAYPKESRP